MSTTITTQLYKLNITIHINGKFDTDITTEFTMIHKITIIKIRITKIKVTSMIQFTRFTKHTNSTVT